MTTVQSLNKSISDMSDEESLKLILNIRRLRLIIPEKKREVVAKKSAAKAKSAQLTIDLFQGMSSEERANLIKLLEES